MGEKKYLDYTGLQTYHENLQLVIEGNEEAISVALEDLDDRLKAVEDKDPYSKDDIDNIIEPINSKLENIEDFAEVNVQSDWNQTDTSADDYIKNKPTIPSPYTLPIASANTLGGIKIGDGLSIDNNGVLSAEEQEVEIGETSPVDNNVKLFVDTNLEGTIFDVYTKSQVDAKLVPEKLGFGIGICSTAAATAAKEVSISNFVLTKNGQVSIKFASGIEVGNATLNINSTGAKPIYINGGYVNPGEIRAGMTANMVYDGTAYKIVSLLGMEESYPESDLYVDMGLPSGLLWAKRNIDVTQSNGFAASEYQYECSFFSFGNIDAHNPTSNNSFSPYDWGTSISGEPYASSEGAKIVNPSSAGPSHDAARTILGAPWRMPDSADFEELFNSDYTKFIDANGDDIPSDQRDKIVDMPDASGTGTVKGIRIKSKINSKILFFPCSGRGYSKSWQNYGNFAYYLSRTTFSADCQILYVSRIQFNPSSNNYKYTGYSIRPVQ